MTTIYSFKEFIGNLVVENLHPEIKELVTGRIKNKAAKIAAKIRELVSRGEKTGIEGNMPKGSSRAYMKHAEPEKVMIDGKEHEIPVGTKVAIRSRLDSVRDTSLPSLGEMQNEAENGDVYVNRAYRTLREDSENPGHYETNEEGIFPPLLHHDYENHRYSVVGHAKSINKKRFRELTRNEQFPKGISHEDFMDALTRAHDEDNGRHRQYSKEREAELDKISQHPKVASFINHQRDFGSSPSDYYNIGNLGEWHNPSTGKDELVARDHGFSSRVADAYRRARHALGVW